MPNTWTHILFADQLCEDLGREDILKTSSTVLHMGAQGPDPFFYHNFLPFLPNKKVPEIGRILHTEKCGPFLLDMIERGKTAKNTLQVYILGFLSHHILDRHTHPYIHYHAGYVAHKHQELEVIIDTILLKRERNQHSWKTPVHKEIKIGKEIVPITSLLESLLRVHFPTIHEKYKTKDIYHSFLHMQAAQRVLYDPWKWKNVWFHSLVSPFSHQPIVEHRDFLNEDRLEWNHPATFEKRNESFLDLYEFAIDEGRTLFQNTFDYWESSDISLLSEIQKDVANISYDTGEPLETSLRNQYSSPIV
ncbi:zinc dependent phospholipase C family protein [Halobacillus karajensis]|uniref:Phospholipase C/D domain-containing protein n=1 Tax=Halobacillus karajensis TaxID=195088 RepID=A0A059NWA0_9BACI|nr:zinc dependent phospholipase C family protein [Halobacillus karajensis]CDQ21132.1 hypothetical protein BN982_03495 [Halobacillus karajensis]CDQ24804.1 hypothetical protein BN983_03103 [Halobacillus karajensis]CDQ28836.1 hypothetical protein BN981_03151 [Halobacillus karajensis]